MKRRTPSRRRSRRQQGVAIITALVVVAAATVAVSAMMWRQSIAVRKVENQAAIGEARWLARSALDWARLILLQDARTSAVDYAGELWAVPLAETRVADDGANLAGDSIPAPAEQDAAYVGGRMRDAQARLNLTGLAVGDQTDEAQLAIFTRLLEVLGASSDLAGVFAARMAETPRPDDYDRLAADMVARGELDSSAADTLRPFVVVLPTPTPINLNTAPPEVLAAAFPDLPLDSAKALAQSRDRIHFNQVSDALGRLPGTSGKTPPGNVSVATHFFEVDGHVRVGRAELEVVALIERDANGATRVRSLRER